MVSNESLYSNQSSPTHLTHALPKMAPRRTLIATALLPSLTLAQGSLNALQACRIVPYSPASAEPVIHLFCRTAAHAGLPPAPHARARAENLTNSHLVSEKGNPPIATVEFSKFVFPRAMAFF